MTPLRQRMLEDLRVRNYSPRTQTVYIQHVARFAGHFGTSPDRLGKEEIRSYLVQLVEARTHALRTRAPGPLKGFVRAIHSPSYLRQSGRSGSATGPSPHDPGATNLLAAAQETP